MARDVLMERRVAQAGTLQARSTAVDTEAWDARPTQRHTQGVARGEQRLGPLVETSVL